MFGWGEQNAKQWARNYLGAYQWAGGQISLLAIYRYIIQIMCYEESKIRVIKTKNGHQPLIHHKKALDKLEKENEKFNFDQPPKPRNHHPDFTSTVQFDHKPPHNYVSIPYQSQHHPKNNHKDRYGHTQPHQQPAYYVQNPKTLTFANARHGSKKEGSTLTEQSSFISLANEAKKAHLPKSNTLLDKERHSNLTERSEKSLIQKQPEKKEQPAKPHLQPKPSFNANLTLDEFRCKEELDFKPVSKKSLIPDKKYTAQKTTSKFDFSNKIKPAQKVQKADKEDDLKRMKQFQMNQRVINNENDSQSLQLLCQLQDEYTVSSTYLQKKHKKVSLWNRGLLVDWMRHISYQFALQRQTYHIAVVLLDNYLSRIANVPRSSLQAIGATCLFMASKLEEFQCRPSQDFVQSTNHSCTRENIQEIQIQIAIALGFRLNPPTLYSLANKMMQQWDNFVKEIAINHRIFKGQGPVLFKQLDQKSYEMFRKMMQLIDCSLLDLETVNYKPQMLVCSFMYLLLGEAIGIFDCRQIQEQFPKTSQYLLSQYPQFNDIFRSYVEHVLAITLTDMLPTVQYCATYFILEFKFEKPMIDEGAVEQMGLEEYCSIQTHNGTLLASAKKRQRNY